MNVKLPLKVGLRISVGDIVEFDKLLGNIAPYGIDYKMGSSNNPNFQEFFPYFMVTETNKRLDSVEISCIQMHKLFAEIATNEPDDDVLEVLEATYGNATDGEFILPRFVGDIEPLDTT